MRIPLAVILAVAFCTAAWADRRVALVFGIDRYEIIRPLTNAVNDAHTIEGALADLGFDVFVETNRDLKRMRRALRDFAADADGTDVALVFFAGHGVEVAGVNRLLPTDADASSIAALEATSLPLEEVREVLEKAGRIRLIVLDACRNDPFAISADPQGRGVKAIKLPSIVKPGLGRVGKGENMLFAFSAAPGRTAADGKGQNSLFTKSLKQHMYRKGYEFRKIMIMVRQEVYALSRSAQMPYLEDGLPDFFFAAGQPEPISPYIHRLLEMEEVSPTLRAEIENVAFNTGIDLLPLYDTAISENLERLEEQTRKELLRYVARAISQLSKGLNSLPSNHPQVMELREEARKQLSRGEVDIARSLLAKAIRINQQKIDASTNILITDLLDHAADYQLSAKSAQTKLDYEAAIGDFRAAADLYERAYKHAAIEGRAVSERELQQYQALLSELGESQRTIGILDAAESTFAIAHSTIEKALEKQPGDPRLRDLLAFNKMKIGDMRFFAANNEAALEIYRESLTIRRSLYEGDPDNLVSKRNLAIILERMGSVLQRFSRFEEARGAHQESFDLISEVSNFQRQDTEIRRDVGVAYNKLGLVLRQTGDEDGAKRAHKAALDIFSKLAESKPDDTKLIHDIGYSLEYLGDVFSGQEETEKAFDSYRYSADFREMLVEINPRHDTWRWELYWTYLSAADHTCAVTQKRLFLTKAQQFLQKLNSEGSLTPGQAGRLDDLKKRIAEAERANCGVGD